MSDDHLHECINWTYDRIWNLIITLIFKFQFLQMLLKQLDKNKNKKYFLRCGKRRLFFASDIFFFFFMLIMYVTFFQV